MPVAPLLSKDDKQKMSLDTAKDPRGQRHLKTAVPQRSHYEYTEHCEEYNGTTPGDKGFPVHNWSHESY